jgi:beta-lactamase regulating signal transducer with metallopeptidase domain
VCAQAVRLFVSASTTTPITWGARRPVILLPESATEWPDARRRAVLRHELAHIARGDAHARWLAAVVCVLYWFHPLAWLIVRALRTESEAACDDQVVADGMAPGEYAEHLLAIARETRTAGPPGFLAARMASQPQIARRILALLDDTRRR